MDWWSKSGNKKKKPSVREIIARELGPNSMRYEFRKKEDHENTIRRTPVYGQGPGSYKPNHNDDVYGASAYVASDEYNYYDSYPRERNHRHSHWIEPEKKKEFAWTPKKWSNYNFYGFTHDTTEIDDNSKLMVKEPESYLTPTAEEIKQKVAVYSRDKIDTIKEYARVCYFKMIDDREYLSELYSKDETIPIKLEDFAKKKQVLDEIYDTFLPGFSPLEQAIAIHWRITDTEANRNAQGNPGQSSTSIAVFERDVFCNPILNNLVDKNPYAQDSRFETLNNISLVGKMGEEFKVELDVSEKEVHNAITYKKKVMSSFEQVTKVDMIQRMLPNFETRFLTKDLIINMPVNRSEKKQKLIILCDYSGSMSDRKKQNWVNGILMERMKYVIKGEAEIFFSFFVSSTYDLKFYHLKDEKSVNEFWSNFSNYPGGSTTDIGRIVQYVANEVKSGKLHNLKVDLSRELPEILIINDGQDKVHVSNFPYKVNAVSLLQFSDQLKQLCIDSGGKQIQICENRKIFCHNKEGCEELIQY